MRILVAVKRVVDYNSAISLASDGSGVDTQQVKLSMNPYDEVALEEAIRLKECQKAQEVIAVSVGDKHSEETLRTALAMGADRGILVQTQHRVEPLGVAKILREIVEKEDAKLVLLGRQAIDDDANQTAQMLAALLDWGQGIGVSEVIVENGQVEVVREVDNGQQTLLLSLPAVISADLRLNTPRFASLPNIMKAKKKAIETLPATQLQLDLTPRQEIVDWQLAEAKKNVVMLNSVDELIEKIKTSL